MTEPKDQNTSSAAETPATGRRSPLAAVALVLVVLLGLAGVGAGFYLYRALEAVRAEQAAQVDEAELARRLEPLVAQPELERALSAVQGGRAQLEQALSALRQETERLGGEQRALDQRLQRIDQLAASTLADWIRAEASYLAKVAVYRARYYQDPDAALAALRTADALLSRLGGDAVDARQAIHRAIDALVAVNPAEVGPIAERIEALARQVDVLPIDRELGQIIVETEPEAPAEGGSRFARAWERFKATLGELVVVNRGQRVEPLLVPEERYFLYHNLRLRLEAARLALIDRNEDLYQDSLARAAEWIERYYATGEPEVHAALEAIRQLMQIDIAPDMPDIAPILEPVTQA